MSADAARLQSLLGGAELAQLRQRLRARFRRAAPAESFTLTALTAAERHALEGLLGRSASSAGSMRLSQQVLDQALARAGIAADLRTALEALDGPLESHAERAQRALAWTELAQRTMEPRLLSLLQTPAGLGLLKRLAGKPDSAAAMINAATQVLERLPAQGMPLAQLAAVAVHDAHALDAGGGLAALVLRAAETTDLLPEEAAADASLRSSEDTRSRNRWARLGIVVNEFASPVLCLNLEADTDSVGGRMLASARDAGEPLHLSLSLLLREPPRWRVSGRSVYVCENPAIVAIAARQLGKASAALICTDGMPSAAQRTLLDQLSAAGALLRYHGDFDWPGITIGNFVMRRFGARPWRFAAADYRGRSGKPLGSGAVAASWDQELVVAMSSAGYRLHEEAVAELLLEDLAA
ncbi:MAG: hypothetical protein JWQ90_5520 [Hydrocarboniphaga sp.]|uniref:TIGR02679 family protein n=1 Tax=Hydrocarboniphaga sp. TaxID=2033016 RepID=UPI00260DEC5A|nr:TIGR02679 family protein [Hydrocarboniphaga sp.]MDB5973070.1 hypothetical protein [Hydrocarboniphaga sp.]